MRTRPQHPPAPTPLARLTRHRLLTARQEQTLARRARKGDLAARARLIESNIRLVHKIASTYMGGGLEFEDMVQEGIAGLIRAIDKFDPARQTRLSTYASYWIKQAIGRALAVQSRTIRLPVHAHDQARVLAQASRRLATAFGRAPSLEERARATGLPIAQVIAIDRADGGTASLQTLVGDGTATLGDFVADRHDATEPIQHDMVADDAERHAIAQAVRELLDHLSPREHLILDLRFGLDNRHPRTFDEISQSMGISHERVRQIEQQALKKLRPLAHIRGLDGRHAP